MQEKISESIRYWESRRPVFNIVLAVVVVSTFVYNLPGSFEGFSWGPAVGLLLAAALANVLYSTAYFVDVFLKLSAYRELWLPHRWILLAAGTLLAAGLFLFHE